MINVCDRNEKQIFIGQKLFQNFEKLIFFETALVTLYFDIILAWDLSKEIKWNGIVIVIISFMKSELKTECV